MKKLLIYFILISILAMPLLSADFFYFRQDVSFGAGVTPATNNAVDLGSTSKWFRDVYLGTSGSFYTKLTTTPSANRTITFPDASFTVAGLSVANAFTAAQTITSTSASALAVGANGATNPVLKVNAATASVATGVEITGAAAGNGATVAAISSGTNENLILAGKGTGGVAISANGTAITYATHGTGTLVAGTVTINNTNVTANSRILVTRTSSGTGVLYISAKTASTSFAVTSSDGADTGTFDYWIVN